MTRHKLFGRFGVLAAALATLAIAAFSPVAYAADLTVTAANVAAGINAIKTGPLPAGAAITAGQVIYLDATNRWQLADSNSGTVLARKGTHIALNSASAGQPLTGQRKGDITVGATLTPNTAYYLSDTPGGICPLADVGTGEYMTLLGVAKSNSVLAFDPISTGVAN